MKAPHDIDYALARFLLEAVTTAKDKNTNLDYTVTYSDCADALSDALGRKVYAHGGLTKPLYRVGKMCNNLGLPLITAIVRLKSARTEARVGDGFYKMACEFRPEYRQMNPSAAWKTELGRVQSCSDWSALTDSLRIMVK